MAFFKVPNVRINGIAACVPKNTQSNLEGPAESQSERDLLVKSIGVNFKRVAAAGMTCADLGLNAAQRLLAELDWDRNEIDALIMVTQTGDYPIPASAILLQSRLELPKSTLALDINLGCSGYPYGLSVMGSLISQGNLRKALLVVGDTSADLTADRGVSSLFGDCCTVTALSYDTSAPEMIFDLNSNGKGFEAVYIRSGGKRHPPTAEDLELKLHEDGVIRRGTGLVLNGVDVLNFAVREVPLAVKNFLKQTDTTADQYDSFVFHQASLMINETIRRLLKLDKSKVPSTLYDFGNTSSASIPLTIHQQLRDQIINGSQRVLMCGFGVGLSWGTASINLDKIACPPLIEI